MYLLVQVVYAGARVPYSQTLSDIEAGQTAYVRVKVIDYNNGLAYTTPAHQVQLPEQCRAPSKPPGDLRVTGTGPTQIRVLWTVRARRRALYTTVSVI